MFKNMSYNQRKCFRFVAAIAVVCFYILSFVTEGFFSEIIMKYALLAGLIAYIIGIFLCGCRSGNFSKVMQDELTLYNEKKAAEFTCALAVVLIFLGMIFTQFTGSSIVLSYDVLVCMMVAVYIIQDGYYLVLEKKGGANADTEDEG